MAEQWNPNGLGGGGNVVVNEAFARVLGEAIGQVLSAQLAAAAVERQAAKAVALAAHPMGAGEGKKT